MRLKEFNLRFWLIHRLYVLLHRFEKEMTRDEDNIYEV